MGRKKKFRLSDIPMPKKRPKYWVFDKDGNEINKGDTVTDFRGETATFQGVERGPEGHKSAKVMVEERPGSYYAQVFGLKVFEIRDK